jgi:hypothetical protein
MLREAYWRWHDTKGASADQFYSLFGDQLEFRSLGAGGPGMEFTAICKSQSALRRYFKGLAKDWSMNFYHIHDYVAEDDHVVAIGECSWTHRRTGKTVVTPKVDVWRFVDGKAVSFFELFDTAQAFAATQGKAVKPAAKAKPAAKRAAPKAASRAAPKKAAKAAKKGKARRR